MRNEEREAKEAQQEAAFIAGANRALSALERIATALERSGAGRKCEVQDFRHEWIPAIFHGWFQKGDASYARVEFEDGHTEEVYDVRFVGKGFGDGQYGKFQDYDL